MSEPVTVIARRRVRPGSEPVYEDWLDRLTKAAQDLPGYVGAEFHRPKAGGQEYKSVFRFDSVDNLEAFERSQMRADFLAEIAPHVEADAVWDRMTGLEVWFDPPPGTVVPQPSPHRMALLLIAVVFVLVMALNLALNPLIGGWPLALRLMLTVILQVLLMTYVIMPRLTRALAHWIYPSTQTVS